MIHCEPSSVWIFPVFITNTHIEGRFLKYSGYSAKVNIVFVRLAVITFWSSY